MIVTALSAIYTLAQTASSTNDPVQTFILWAGGILTTACAAVFNFIRTKLKECEEDRVKLMARIEEMHKEFSGVKDDVANLMVRTAVAEREQDLRNEIAERDDREDEGRPDSIQRIEYTDSTPRIEHEK